jgi:murein DD-endopeptidase MepM/ murein hydrolase activator NlpD
MTLRPYIRGGAAVLVAAGAALALAVGDAAAPPPSANHAATLALRMASLHTSATAAPGASARSMVAVALAKRLHTRVVEGLADPVALEREVFPILARPDYGDGEDRFGATRSGHMHEGQDVFAPPGTPLVAMRSGVVVETGDDGGRGNYVAVFSPPFGETYMYLHMLRPVAAHPGDTIVAGDRIGRVGCTGSCWGDHLHLELRHGRGTLGEPQDPLPLLRQLDAG